MNDKVDIALVHAIGQDCSTVHVKNHALSIVFYTLTAIVIGQHYVAYALVFFNQSDAYKCRMAFWKENGALKANRKKGIILMR